MDKCNVIPIEDFRRNKIIQAMQYATTAMDFAADELAECVLTYMSVRYPGLHRRTSMQELTREAENVLKYQEAFAPASNYCRI